jgi:hypothetical protein
MNALEKIKLIDKIGIELQSRMSFYEIDAYFSAYGIPTDHKPTYNSKKVYVKEILPKISDDIVIQIANDLQIVHNYQNKLPIFKDATTTFWKTGHFKLFISHLSTFKETIGRLKTELEKYGISSFVAHEDIEPTKEWQEEIEKSLFSMDAMCAVLMPGFKESNWTDQEVGVAVGRGVLVIPILKELDPYGFIGKYQGFQAQGKNIAQVAEAVFLIITKNSKTRNKIISCLVDLLLLSNDKSAALERISALKKINDLPTERIFQMKTRFIENQNLKDNEIISNFNDLIKKYDIEGLRIKDFDKVQELENDDLPF